MCPPGLHISLGIFFRLFTLLEDACHELDVLAPLQQTTGNAGSSFIKYTEALQTQSTLRDGITTIKTHIDSLEQLLTLMAITLPPGTVQTIVLEQIASEVTAKKKEVEEMVQSY